MKKNLQEISDYIIQFLLGNENSELSKLIGYTSNPLKFSQYKLVIFPSEFFSENTYKTERSLPKLPLENWEEIPLLFGNPKQEKQGDTILLYADIVASSFFLISRYEEVIYRSDRDEHGRFQGKKCLPFRAGFLERPIVDEYGKALRKLLREIGLDVKEPKSDFNRIYLTHDADQIAHYRNFRGMTGAISRFFKSPYQSFKAIQSYFGGIQHDPWFTFPWLFDLANQVKKQNKETDIETIVFVKSGGSELNQDKPIHDVLDKDFTYLFELCRKNEVKIGLHPSYQAGQDIYLIAKEKEVLEKAIYENVKLSRNHYLRSREPEDFQALINAGITDDFTMSYADVAGFRLGTCRAVKWIHPISLRLTSLTLHATTMMDSTLSDIRYMNLNKDDAFAFSKKLIDTVREFNGDLVLLWHNTSVEKENGMYHRELYEWMINYLKTER
ncbi:MAG TPA: hypothetical protein GXZ87_02450 [Bacteroidales bacterium]|nr:hypothetical protein [Bacteroidales bacterium]